MSFASSDPPVLADVERSVDENSDVGTNVGSVVTGTDEDSADTLTYSITGGNAGAAPPPFVTAVVEFSILAGSSSGLSFHGKPLAASKS